MTSSFSNIYLMATLCFDQEITCPTSILGVLVVGALTALYGGTTTKFIIANGDKPIVIQEVLDGIMPHLIPLEIKLMLYFLIKKGWSPVKCIGLVLLIGLLSAFVGVF